MREGRLSDLLNAIAWTESRGRDDVESRRGALGRYQILPATAYANGCGDPRDPAAARACARRLITRYWRRYGSVQWALAAYCAGPRRIQRLPWAPAIERYVSSVLERAGMRPASDGGVGMVAVR